MSPGKAAYMAGHPGPEDLPLKKKEAYSEEIAGLAAMKKNQALAKSSAKCCEEERAECKACGVHMPVIFYCRRYPTTPGCAEVRQRSTPKSRSPPATLPRT
jgi:hypothetical protein